MRSTMRRIVCAVLLGVVVGNGVWAMPVPSGGIVARPGGIVAGGCTSVDSVGMPMLAANIAVQVSTCQTLKYDLYFTGTGGGALTPEARDNLRWAGLSITVYCILTHRLGM